MIRILLFAALASLPLWAQSDPADQTIFPAHAGFLSNASSPHVAGSKLIASRGCRIEYHCVRTQRQGEMIFFHFWNCPSSVVSSEPGSGFTKATSSAFRVHLEEEN
jgi:hypothetical protein